jgi:hypothetical protein
MELTGGGSMSYKIAVASSDGTHIDETFGSAKEFLIYEVTDETYVKSEVRAVEEVSNAVDEVSQPQKEAASQENCGNSGSCGKSGCNSGLGGGCLGGGEVSGKVELISDCRCIVCKKIGFHIQKQLERKAITSFDVTCTVEEALQKITAYFHKVDTHQSFRRTSVENHNT